MEINKFSPKQLPTLKYNSILDFKLDDAVKIIHTYPDCNECMYCLVYKGDGRNVFKNHFEYRCYCKYEAAPIRVPINLERPLTFSDLWMPWDIWKPSLGQMHNEKAFLYIPYCGLVKEMRRCTVKLLSLPMNKWKLRKKKVIGTVDESLHSEFGDMI